MALSRWTRLAGHLLPVAVIFALFIPSVTSVQAVSGPVQQWVARYDGPGMGVDSASALAVDGSGDVYVTGTSWGGSTNMDYSTVKYGSKGNQLWVARYDGLGISVEEASALAVDEKGNVYVAGMSGFDYATLKYDSSGNQLWVARYNGPGNGTDRVRAIAVDGAGNVYVTGDSEGSGTSNDYATIKYDGNGNQLWVARYDGAPGLMDLGYAVAVDAAGNVYVTGITDLVKETGFADYATLKYDSSGTQLWVARYDGPGNGGDYASALAVDAAGSVWVTGSSTGSGSGFDYATLKYDSGGNQLWAARYNGPGNAGDGACALVLDALGNIYVTGYSRGSGDGYDYGTVKYDGAGNPELVARYNGPGNTDDEASSLALDRAGNVYVTGRSAGSGSGYDYATLKYDSAGNQLWIGRYNGPGNSDDKARALVVDGAGNIYVAGIDDFAKASGDYATIKYGPAEAWMPFTPGAGAVSLEPAATPPAVQYWAVGSGTIAHSADGGLAWASQASGLPSNLQDVEFVDAMNGWAVGTVGTILHTSNGGVTWTAQTSGTPNLLYGVDFIGSLNGWISGDNGVILHTSNGGSTWSRQASGVSYGLSGGVVFADSLHGWAAGANWTGSGWAGEVLRTSNGGSTWTEQPTGTGAFVNGVYFVDANRGWVVGNDGAVLRTIDGGVNWTPQASHTSQYLYGLHFVDALRGWAAGLSGTILATADGGANWVAQDSHSYWYLKDVAFADALHGTVVGFNGSTGGVILSTSDGGATWTTRSAGGTYGDLASVTAVKIGGSAQVGVSLTFASAGYRVDDWGTVTKVGDDYRVDATVRRWTGPSAEVITCVSHSYDLGEVAPGAHNFQFYANGTPVKTVPFVVPASAAGPVPPSAAITGLSVVGTPSAGKAATVQVGLRNQGAVKETFTVELYAERKLVGRAAVNGLEAGKARTLYFRWTPAAAGQAKLAVVGKKGGVSGAGVADVRLERSVTVRGWGTAIPPR